MSQNRADDENKKWFLEAARVAQGALCLNAKCGSVIVLNGEIIGSGYNAPPQDKEQNSKCLEIDYDRSKKPKYDLTCCVHAEWRAIKDALVKQHQKLSGATLYYVRIGEDGEIKFSGAPYCTMCSRAALDVGIARFGLWHEEGMKLYDTKAYNDFSYQFHKSK